MNEREDIVMDILEIMKERHSVRQQCGQPNVNLRQVPAQVNE